PRPETTRLSDEDRFAIASAAEASARANRPRSLVLLAMVIFAGSCFYFLLGFKTYRDAEGSMRRAKATYGQLDRLAEEYAFNLRLNASPEVMSVYCDPDPRLVSTMRNIATSSGISDPPLPDESTEQREGVTRRRLRYVNVNDPSIEELLTFVDRVRNEVPCMRVFRTKIEPVRGQSWRMEVGFERLERAR
ncbi:MAG: hypothetical protein CMJ31_09005, partial [Phycisphaerae bacterium]|nr:hypothetical protein [Phycisphaerae bacterium]